MATLDLLEGRLKFLLVFLFFKETRNPVSQRNERALHLRMVMIKIHKTLERCFDAKKLGIEVPGRARLDLNRKGSDPFDIGIPTLQLPLKPDRPANILFLFERNAEGEEEVTVDPRLLHLIKASQQGLICVGMPFMDPAGACRTHVG